MSRLWVGVIAGAVGFGLGLLAAKLYATSTITNDANALLGKVGLGGGTVQSIVDNNLIPAVVS